MLTHVPWCPSQASQVVLGDAGPASGYPWAQVAPRGHRVILAELWSASQELVNHPPSFPVAQDFLDGLKDGRKTMGLLKPEAGSTTAAGGRNGAQCCGLCRLSCDLNVSHPGCTHSIPYSFHSQLNKGHALFTAHCVGTHCSLLTAQLKGQWVCLGFFSCPFPVACIHSLSLFFKNSTPCTWWCSSVVERLLSKYKSPASK
jgi:hypothetical protein